MGYRNKTYVVLDYDTDFRHYNTMKMPLTNKGCKNAQPEATPYKLDV